jgi:hypothetical protein
MSVNRAAHRAWDELMHSSVLQRLCMFAFLLVACVPQETTQVVTATPMVEANRLYEEGRYAEAAKRYQALVDAGLVHTHLYYNLGNAYFKSGDLGHAMLNYRRAQRLLPRDPDVRNNLALALAKTQDRIPAEGTGATTQILHRLFEWTTPCELAFAALIGWLGVCGSLIAAVLAASHRRALLYASGVAAILVLAATLSAGVWLFDENSRPPAVVVVDRTTLRSGPGESYPQEFSLHAGAPVRVIERRAGWTRVLLPGELQGWAQDEAIEEIVPSG